MRRSWVIAVTVGMRDLPLANEIAGPLRDSSLRKWWKPTPQMFITEEWRSEHAPTEMDVQDDCLFAIYQQCKKKGLGVDYSADLASWYRCGCAVEGGRFLKIWRLHGFTGNIQIEPVLEFRDLACLQDNIADDVIRNVILLYLTRQNS